MNFFATLALLLFAYMSAWFVISLVKKRNDVADVAWGLGFVLMAWMSLVLSDAPGARGVVVSILVSVWGLRLAWHIHERNKGRAEDYRYLAWRKAWGKWFFVRSYLQVYLLQGFLLFLIVTPVLLINNGRGAGLGLLDVAGLVVWLTGFYFEAVGDAQLARFIRNPENKGKFLQGGLWAYTRHPNYFGEATMWWGLGIVAFAGGGGAWAFLGPATITYLLLFVSGVPMLEKKMMASEEYRAYARRTSIFFPWPPKPPASNTASR